jgi:hypothetical protein
LEILFQAVYSKQLREIRLLITKADLIREAGIRGLLPGLNGQNVEDYARGFFKGIESQINAACEDNDTDKNDNSVKRCAVRVISLKDESARQVIFELIQRLSA